jgi:hypothetical protein
MLTCLLVATGLLFYLAFRSEMPPVTIIINEGASVHICDGGAVSLKFRDYRESMLGGIGGVGDGGERGVAVIVDDACTPGEIGGADDVGTVGWSPIVTPESQLHRLREVDWPMTFMADTVTLVLRWAIPYKVRPQFDQSCLDSLDSIAAAAIERELDWKRIIR